MLHVYTQENLGKEMHLLKLTKPLLLLFLTFVLTGCSIPRYEVCSSEDFPVYCIQGCRLIILDEQLVNGNKPLFEKTMQLLDDRQYKALEEFLADGNYPYDDLELCQALVQFNQGDYEDALVHLNNVTDVKYECLVKLLKTDAEYEMALSAGLISPNASWGHPIEPQERARNRSHLLSRYQDVFDCDSSEHNQYMVKMRVKQLKYAR